MKQQLRYVIYAVSAAALLATPTMALAEQGGPNSASNSSNSSNETAANSANSTVKTETEKSKTDDSSTDMDRRLSKAKTEFKINLSETQKERIKTRCKPAQSSVKSLGDRFNNGVVLRTKAYTNLSDHLNGLVTKLKAKNIDTTTLEQELVVLKSKIDTFNTDMTAYKQTLTDLRSVNCVTDPAAFQAALAASRTAHDKLVADATDIKTYVTGTIKPTLQAIRAQLEAEEKKSDTSANQEGSN